ncbi:MAG: prephenate dehydrogenase [Lachnospiraceae bacterium]|nr:prephenate dehydrogenase [Lachnospiraceae bacterium]
MSMQKIGFIGLGLIGGSIAKTIKKKAPSTTLIATARHKETIIEAYESRIISNSDLLPLTAFADCDCIFLCTPVQQNLTYLEQLKTIIQPSCIITDVGSVKTDIHKAVIHLDMEKNFIGGHPMCGSEKTGFSNATDHLLENAYYILTPAFQISNSKIQKFLNLIKSLGAIPMILDYETHDYATAAISHLPHIIAASLVNLISDLDDKHETMRTIAAGGFKDITRIASSSPIMWQNICLSNQEQILRVIDSYLSSLQKIRLDIQNKASGKISTFFEEAKDYRDSMTSTTSGLYAESHIVYCDLIDEAGAIATLATIMASHNISIKNIGILHNREFEDGVLQIEFYEKESLQSALKLLSDNHYLVHKR